MRLSPKLANLVITLVVLAFFVVILMWTYQFPEASSRRFPSMVSMAAIVLCLIDLIAQTDTAIGRRLAAVLPGSATIATAGVTRGIRPEAVALLWIAGAAALTVMAGFLAGIPAYVFCYLTLHAGRPVRQGAIAALLTTGAIWLVFQQLLSYQLYRGVLFGD
jgi:hypothetical protein